MLTLCFAPGASSMAPHIALHEIGVPFDALPISFSRKENRTPAYLALNAEGKVPTLLIDGRPLTEVASILFYLARRYPEAGLLPAGDPEAEASVISWMSFIAATVHPARRRGLEVEAAPGHHRLAEDHAAVPGVLGDERERVERLVVGVAVLDQLEGGQARRDVARDGRAPTRSAWARTSPASHPADRG